MIDSCYYGTSGGCHLVGGGSLPDAEIATTGYRHLPVDDAIHAAHHVEARHACKRDRASSDVPVSDMPNRGRDSAWQVPGSRIDPACVLESRHSKMDGTDNI